MRPFAILIGGPTAANKTQLAFEIQRKIPSFIINSDSMQVYDELKTLTNVPAENELKDHSCNLFGFINYPKKCNVGYWLRNVEKILSKQNNKIPIFVGGTGLYLDSLLGNISSIPEISVKVKDRVEKLHSRYGNSFFFKKLEKMDKEYANMISQNDTQRLIRAVCVKVGTGKNMTYWHRKKSKKIFQKVLYVAIFNNRKQLYESIDQRCLKILQSNVLEEVSLFLRKKKKITR